MVSDETVRRAGLYFTIGGLFVYLGALLGSATGSIAGGGIGIVSQLIVFAPPLYLGSRFVADGVGVVVSSAE